MQRDEYLRLTFSSNLKRMMALRDKTAKDMMNDLGYLRSTISEWTRGKKVPRMNKIQTLANYFNCEVTDLVGTADDFALQANSKRTSKLDERIGELMAEIALRDTDFFFGQHKLTESDLEMFEHLVGQFEDTYKLFLKTKERK